MLKERNKITRGEDLMSNQSQKLPKQNVQNNTDLEEVLNKKQIAPTNNKYETLNKYVADREKQFDIKNKSSDGYHHSEIVDNQDARKFTNVKAYGSSLNKNKEVEDNVHDHVVSNRAKSALKNQLGKRIESIRD